jgi:hypothetical protein
VLLAGDPLARAMVHEHLAKTLSASVSIRQLESGGRGEGAQPEALGAEIRDALLHEVWRDRRDILARLQQAVGRHDFAVVGVSAVVEAVRKAQVDTVVLSDDPSSTLEAFIGPNPLDIALQREDLVATGVEDISTERLDAALVRALAGSRAALLITPGGHEYVSEGIGALLRYTDASTPH